MNTNQIIIVFSLDPYTSTYKSYCILSHFLDHIQSVNNTFIIVNSSLSTVKTGHWLYIFQMQKNIEFVDPLGLPNALGQNNFNDLKNGKIGTWNVTTLKNGYHINILTDEFRQFELDLLGVSETHIPEVGSMKLGYAEFVYSGRKDGIHRQEVGLTMNKDAAKSCLGWEGVHNRLLNAHFMTKKFRVSVIVVYAPVELTDGDTTDSDKFTYSYRNK